jgi:hypothetical protein
MRACIHRDECVCVVSVSGVLCNSQKKTRGVGVSDIKSETNCNGITVEPSKKAGQGRLQFAVRNDLYPMRRGPRCRQNITQDCKCSLQTNPSAQGPRQHSLGR